MLTGSLDPENFREFKLVKRAQLSHNVAKFTFALPTPTSVLGLPIGQHISCRFCFLTLFLPFHVIEIRSAYICLAIISVLCSQVVGWEWILQMIHYIDSYDCKTVPFYILFMNVLSMYGEQNTVSNRGKDSQGDEVIKPYTPTTLDSDVGNFELVIKVCISAMYPS